MSEIATTAGGSTPTLPAPTLPPQSAGKAANQPADRAADKGTAPVGPLPASWLDRPVAGLGFLSWEAILWIVLVLVAAALRLYQLGARGMSHDESLHTLYAYYLYNEGRYQHNPMMHGPFRYHITALAYFLFGASDYTSRLFPALFGTALVGILYTFRRWIGRTGAFAAAILVTVSPSLLFHSRYIRDDILIATWTVLWALCAFRYLETRRFRWMFGMAVVMAFSFATMENSFITGVIFGGFFLMLALWEAINWRAFIALAPALLLGVVAYALHNAGNNGTAVLVMLAAALVMVAVLVFFFITGKGAWSRLRDSVAADLSVLMVTLVLPFLAPFVHVLLGGSATIFGDTQYLQPELIRRMAILVGVVALAAVAIAVLWFYVIRRGDDEGRIGLVQWAEMMAVFWVIEILFFTTFFTNTRDGLASGIVGSLGYWLAQQNVQRGGQPQYYYLMLGALYEFVPMILSIGGAIALLWGFLWRREWSPVAESDLPRTGDGWSPQSVVEARNAFVIFALIWVGGMWGAYTVAGEKMPWLLTHMALPMCIFGGWWIGRVLHGIDWSEARRTRAVWAILLAPIVLLLLILFFRAIPDASRDLDAAAGWMRAILTGALAIAAAYFLIRWILAAGWRLGGKLVGVGLLALLFLLNVRASLMLTFVNYDMATEYLVYAHASPDVKRALGEIESISRRTVGDHNIVVAYDDESSWPMSWYFRDYPNAIFYGENPDSNSMSAPIVLVGPKNRDKVTPYLERDYAKHTYRLIWWPDMDYFNMTWERLKFALTDPDQRERLLQIIFFRRHRDTEDFSRFRDLTQWPARHEFDMWVRKDLANQIWDLNVTPSQTTPEENPLLTVPEVDVSATTIFSGNYAGMPLLQPRAVAVAPNGNRVIADSGNNRIVVVDPGGGEVAVFGSRCVLSPDTDQTCVDPDGSGPLEKGDGQFYEPWGVAVDGDGNIYVSDTWNGRIQVFDPTGKFLRKWGYFNSAGDDLADANALYGPRGINFDLAGNLVVADTGNKRIVRYKPDGTFVDQVGGGGVVAGRFDEPTGVATDPRDGSILVADAWNKRIQRFDDKLTFLAEYPVPSWESREIYHKPGIAVTTSGDIYVTDPQFYRVFVLGPDGAMKAMFGRYGSGANQFGMPNGIAADLPGNAVIVADADNNRVMEMPDIQ